MSTIFAFDQCNRLVHITEVERGLACNCHCVVCAESLIARQGEKREHHFAHASNVEPCVSDHESLLHRYAKQCIVEANGLVVPMTTAVAQVLGISPANECDIMLASQQIDEEVSIGGIRPDLLVTTTTGNCVALEVAYSSFCTADKIAQYETLQVPVLEIDLSSFTPDAFDPQAVKTAVIGSLTNKTWLWPTRAPVATELPKVTPPYLPEEIIDFSGRWVSVKTLPSGDLSVRALRPDHNLYGLIKSVAYKNFGKYQPPYKSWWIPRWRAIIAREQLRHMSKEVVFTVQMRGQTGDSVA